MSDKDRKRIGVLGGTFDPVHNGHLGLAEEVLEIFRLDEILFIPAHLAPHKREKITASKDHRLEMLRLAIGSRPNFEVSDMELNRGGVSYTIETLADLKSHHPDCEYYLIMGLDAFNDIGTWKDVQKLVRNCHILVGSRPGHPGKHFEEILRSIFPPSQFPYFPEKTEVGTLAFRHRESNTLLIFFQIVPRDISSSSIREKIAKGSEIKNLLPPKVENYIIEYQLYGAKSHPDAS
jgi:nicotinate-nucleotide adenylyltransferase